MTRAALLVAALLAVAARPVRACDWDSETAEAHALPCVHDAIVGHYGRHTNESYETRIAAADAALAWARAAQAPALGTARPPLFRAIARDGMLHRRMTAALGAITDAEMACRAGAAGKHSVGRPG